MKPRNIPRGTLQITVAQVSQYLIMGLFYIIVAKTNALSQAEIGALSVLSFLSSVIVLVTGLALPTALLKFVSEHMGKGEPDEAASVRRTIIKVVLFLSIGGFLICVLFSKQLSTYVLGSSVSELLVILTLLYTLLYGLLVLWLSSLQALGLFGKMAIANLLLVILSRVLGAILALGNMGLTGVLVGYNIGAVTALAIAVVSLRHKFPPTHRNAPFKPMLRFGLPLLLANTMVLVLNWADIVTITAVTLNYSITGSYYIALSSLSALSVIYVPITTTIFPAISAKQGLNKVGDITEIMRIASRYLLYAIIPTCLGLATVSPTALSFFYGAGYSVEAISLSILSISTIITAFVWLFTTALTAIGKTTQILEINAVQVLSELVFLVITVPFLQTEGAAITRLVVQSVGIALAVYFLQRVIRVRVDKEALWKSGLASIVCVPLLLVVEGNVNKNLTITQALITEIVLTAGVYILVLRVLRALKAQDFEFLRQALPEALAKYITAVETIMV